MHTYIHLYNSNLYGQCGANGLQRRIRRIRYICRSPHDRYILSWLLLVVFDITPIVPYAEAVAVRDRILGILLSAQGATRADSQVFKLVKYEYSDML